jgi:hypothetical protein
MANSKEAYVKNVNYCIKLKIGVVIVCMAGKQY